MDNIALTASANQNFLSTKEKDLANLLKRTSQFTADRLEHYQTFISKRDGQRLNSSGKIRRGLFKNTEDDGAIWGANNNFLRLAFFNPNFFLPPLSLETLKNTVILLKSALGTQPPPPPITGGTNLYVTPQNIQTIHASDAFKTVVDGYVSQQITQTGADDAFKAIAKGYKVPFNDSVYQAFGTQQANLLDSGVCFSAEHDAYAVCAEKLAQLRTEFVAGTGKEYLGSHPLLVFNGVTQTIKPAFPSAPKAHPNELTPSRLNL